MTPWTYRLSRTSPFRCSSTMRGGMTPGRLCRRLPAAVLTGLLVSATLTGTADARSTRESSGYTGRHVHAGWAGPGVGLIAWTTSADFVSRTGCGSSTAYVEVDSAWNSASLHNGAELDIMFSVVRTDGRHFELGRVFKITDARPWPGHPAFDGQFRASVFTPRGMYLRSATVTSWIVNGGVAYPPVANDTVRLQQWTKSC